jgi:type VI secretion system protein ImpJ
MLKTFVLEERIQWHEGMLLAPQHFQQTSARTDALVALHTLLAAPFVGGCVA